MIVSGREMIKKGAQLNVWRAPLANEIDEWGFWSSNNKHLSDFNGKWASSEWFNTGLDNLQMKINFFQCKDQ